MRILLAIDHSAASEVAVSAVALRPWPAGSSVEILSVVEPPHAWAVSEIADRIERSTRDLVNRAAERLRSCGLNAASTVLTGNPKETIVQHAGESKADLVVAGSHGAAGLTRFLLGSVAHAVVRFAPCSVEVVRGTPAQRPLRVLLATDGSESSMLAARSIASRPWFNGTEVRILSVVELALSTLQAMLEPPFADSAAMEALREHGMKQAQDAIRAAEEIITGAGLKTSEDISVLLDPPKQIILDEARQWGADLIVAGSHGRRGINRFLLGSVSEAVAMHAECSVEVIR